MTDFKPKDFEEVIKDAVGSALNDNSTFYEDEMGRCSDNYIPAENFNEVENDILKNLKENEYINIEFKSKREILRLLLEGENGFYGNYFNECQNGSLKGLSEIINKTIDEIFKIFKENKDE